MRVYSIFKIHSFNFSFNFYRADASGGLLHEQDGQLLCRGSECGVEDLVETFDIEPFPDFSAK